MRGLSPRSVSLKRNCTYKVRVKLNKKAGRRGTVKFSVSFRGNDVLKSDSGKRVSRKYGR